MADNATRKTILMGRIGAAHGLGGEVRLQSFCAEPADIAAYSPLATGSGARITISALRPAKSMFIARIEGVNDRNAAEKLNGTELFVARERLGPEEDEDEFFHADLIGLATVHEDGTPHGTILAVPNYGADDMLEIRLKSGQIAVLPFTRAVVPVIDLDAGRVTVAPPDEIAGEPDK